MSVNKVLNHVNQEKFLQGRKPSLCSLKARGCLALHLWFPLHVVRHSAKAVTFQDNAQLAFIISADWWRVWDVCGSSWDIVLTPRHWLPEGNKFPSGSINGHYKPCLKIGAVRFPCQFSNSATRHIQVVPNLALYCTKKWTLRKFLQDGSWILEERTVTTFIANSWVE